MDNSAVVDNIPDAQGSYGSHKTPTFESSIKESIFMREEFENQLTGVVQLARTSNDLERLSTTLVSWTIKSPKITRIVTVFFNSSPINFRHLI